MKTKEFQKVLQEKNIDACILFNTSNNKKDYNATYFSGLDLELFFVVIPKKKKPFVIVSNLEIGRAKKISKLPVIGFEKDLFKLLKKKIGNVNSLGVNFKNVSLFESKLLKKEICKKLVDVSDGLKELRETKTNEEIKIIEKAAKVGDEIFSETIKNWKNLKTEIDVKLFMDSEIRKRGFEPAFETVVNSGSNASHGHFSAQDERLKKGFCILDFGVKIDNYNSDMTRTIYIGNPSKKEIETYNNLKIIQQKCIDSIKECMKFSDLDNIARKSIGKELIHALGHGLGIEVHEGPNVGPSSKDKIKIGHLFTVEPGIYVKDKFGIRIEDDVVLTKKGVKVLTKSSKELITV
ncbi:hypothetical protein C0585_06310 [Candidatus Woesearchaeota archaeon]|nr:MAG: hypothetical protein C0585_06310 [Candidatus Woesearchaeota archaeon]